ncbi:MAG: lipase family protein [Asticcacaulis sp.]|uniref:lipase family protein n=1 Tax=Asticcacaulis sp. TaxID=1872648 RepID=UPI0039E3BEF2
MTLRQLLAGVIAVAVAISPLAASSQTRSDRWAGDGGVTAFYTYDLKIPAQPGVMLRTEAASAEVSVPSAGSAYRILYSSLDWRDGKTPITVSGLIFFPKGAPPKGGWPILAWSHGTTGVADVCAPSLNPRSERDRIYLSAWLDDGYAIVATDYSGLGTPGAHPYLQYRSEGMAVLDSVRAALKAYPGKLQNKIVTIGQSQGSGAAIAAAYLAPTYARDLRIKGTVATGIVAHTTHLNGARQEPVPSLYTETDTAKNAGYEMLYFLGTVRSIDPDGIRPEDYISDAAWPLLEKAQSTCLSGLSTYAGQLGVTVDQLYKQPIDELEKRADQAGDFPDVKIRTPVFVGTGLADSDAQTATQYNFVSAMCAARDVVEWHYYPGATHSSAVLRSRADSPAFVEAVMHGRKIANRCGSLVPPGPLQAPDS